MNRKFEDQTAVRAQVPLLIGLMGPSGGGKTFSALRLATGIRTVTGGDIYYIDTEARRALHYADVFQFRHVDFKAPYGSLDYLAAIQHCVAKGAGVIVIDSASHEHEGPGGLVDFHEKELDRMAGSDFNKRERVNMLAWSKPKQARRQLINGILQQNTNFIFCFRAKQSAKPVKGKDGKTEIVQQGFMPIAGDDFVYEMTACCLLMPHAGGVPTWESEFVGERIMIKPAEQFRSMFREPQALSEQHGVQLAEWARGKNPEPRANVPDLAREAAQGGSDVFEIFWKGCTRDERAKLMPLKDELAELRRKADTEQAQRGQETML